MSWFRLLNLFASSCWIFVKSKGTAATPDGTEVAEMARRRHETGRRTPATSARDVRNTILLVLVLELAFTATISNLSEALVHSSDNKQAIVSMVV